MYQVKKLGLKSLIAFILLTVSSNISLSQDFKINNLKSSISIFGTSSLHDWEEVVNSKKGTMVLINSEGLQIQKLYLEILSESLKSGKNAMDKNTYKALKTDEYKTITFQFIKSLEFSATNGNNYKAKILGDLTITGVTKRIQLEFNLQVTDNELKISGEKEIEMTDYKIDPPKALFGTITTGNKLIIRYNIIMDK